MSKNIQHLQHIKSNVVTEGKPKLPTPSVLVDGELAVNYAEGYETISLKNSNGSITTFSSDDYYTAKKLGSGFTGVNSANTVTSVIEDNEEAISAALNDLNERKMDASAYTPTDLSNYYTKSETYAKSETSGKTEIANAVNDLDERVNDHVSNSDIHIKSGGEVIYNLTNVSGTTGGTNHCASWSGDCSSITELYDGLNIQLKLPVAGHASGCTISINGDEQHKCILNASSALKAEYPVGSIVRFVYDSSQSGSVYTGSSTPLSVQGVWKVSDYNTNTNTLEYQIRTNSSTLPVSDATYRYRLLFTSADGSHWVPANTSTNTGATAIRDVNQRPINPFGPMVFYNYTTALSAGANVSAAYQYQQMTLSLGYSFNRTGAALTLSYPAPVYIKATPQNDGSAIIDADTPYVQALPTTEDDKIYIFLGIAYSATTVEMRLEHPIYWFKGGKITQYIGVNDAAYMDVESALTPSSSASTNLVTAKAVLEVIKDNEEVVASSLNDLNERKLDVSAYTPTDLSNYYTKSETSGATEISNALGAKASVSWVEDRLGSGFTSENSGITVTEAIEENEEIISAALNDLDTRKLDASAYTPTDLTNYYTKSQTSGATEISTALGTKEDTVKIDSTAKTSSFNASVGKYYVVNVPNDGSVTVTLPTSNMSSTNVQNIIFLVTLGSGTASIAFTPIEFKSEGFNNMTARNTYEVNALWNGTNWIMAMTKLEAVQ